jgi:hypothetical protein
MDGSTTVAMLFTRMGAREAGSAQSGVLRPRQMKDDPKYQENSEPPAQPEWPDWGDLGPVKPLNDVRILVAYVTRDR